MSPAMLTPGASTAQTIRTFRIVAHVLGDNRHAMRGRCGGKPLGEPVVDLDGRHRGAGLEDRERQRPEPGTDLDHPVARSDPGHLDDPADRVRVDDEILPELLGRGDIKVGGESADLRGTEEGHGHATTVTIAASRNS